MARSGVAAAELLLRRGARVVAADRKPAAELPAGGTALQEKGDRLALGGHDAATRGSAGIVAVFLNLPPDHLDRHPSFEDYARAKARIFRNQTEEDWAVVNADDPGVLALAREGRARQMPFHPRPSPPAPDEGGPGAFFDAGEARLRRDRAVESLFPLSGVRLPGAHLA